MQKDIKHAIYELHKHFFEVQSRAEKKYFIFFCLLPWRFREYWIYIWVGV